MRALNRVLYIDVSDLPGSGIDTDMSALITGVSQILGPEMLQEANVQVQCLYEQECSVLKPVNIDALRVEGKPAKWMRHSTLETSNE